MYRTAYLVIVKRTGVCIDASRTRAQARESARDLTDAMEPCVVVPMPYWWEPPARRARRRKP
jgi:hypothetical protein